MFERFHPYALGCLLGLLIAASSASATDLLDASWKGEDVILRFSDSASYTIDLAESDSSQLVIRFHNLTLAAPVDAQGTNMRGPNGLRALLTQPSPNEARLTVLGRGRLGYASLWRPYSHTLVIHTFDWTTLDYPTEQYYKGLLALEQGLDAAGIEMLKQAHTTGEPRAASALGVYYARHGNTTMARQYLANPVDADDNAALAAIAGRSGDNATAQANQEQFDQKTARRDTAWQGGGTIDPPRPMAWNEGDGLERKQRMERMKWIYMGGGVLLLLIIIWIVVAMARRSSKKSVIVPPAPAKPQFEQVRRTPEPTPPVPVAADRPNPPAPVVADKPTAPAPVAVEEPAPIVEEELPVAITQESPVEEVPATVVVEPPAMVVVEPPAPVIAEAPAQVIEAEPAAPMAAAEPEETAPAIETLATPPAAEAPPAEAGPAETKAGRLVPTQAAELRRKLEAMREAATAQAPPQPIQTPPTTNKQTITEARRLKLSRDSVELRRRLDEAGR
jgi:hypothetical protein